MLFLSAGGTVLACREELAKRGAKKAGRLEPTRAQCSIVAVPSSMLGRFQSSSHTVCFLLGEGLRGRDSHG